MNDKIHVQIDLEIFYATIIYYRYLGRNSLLGYKERAVAGSNILIWPNYSYSTVAYALSNKGARKLLDQKPLKHLVPVDEFLSIMFDRNPNGE